MMLSFQHGTSKIDFEVIYRKRKTMEIRVEPPGKIKVISPEGLPEDLLMETVQRKSKWIQRALSSVKDMEYQPYNREFVNGESFLYLGGNYPLQIEIDESMRRPEVKLNRGNLLVKSPSEDQEIVRRALETWYRMKCQEKVEERIEYYKDQVGAGPTEIKVKEQKRRWGSCTAQDRLLFNWRCIMAPSYILDYIVVHEMCHLIYKNHSKDYWASVAEILPDYKERRQWLKKNGIKMDF